MVYFSYIEMSAKNSHEKPIIFIDNEHESKSMETYLSPKPSLGEIIEDHNDGLKISNINDRDQQQHQPCRLSIFCVVLSVLHISSFFCLFTKLSAFLLLFFMFFMFFV